MAKIRHVLWEHCLRNPASVQTLGWGQISGWRSLCSSRFHARSPIFAYFLSKKSSTLFFFFLPLNSFPASRIFFFWLSALEFLGCLCLSSKDMKWKALGTFCAGRLKTAGTLDPRESNVCHHSSWISQRKVALKLFLCTRQQCRAGRHPPSGNNHLGTPSLWNPQHTSIEGPRLGS